MYLDAQGNVTGDSLTGYRASGVPGTVRGLEYASKKWGRKPWAELVHPAVELAAKGFDLSYGQAQSLKANERALSRFPESKRIFLRDGKLYEAGERFRQPELARTLERLERRGATDFYEGETAMTLAKEMRAHGGLITLEDLKSYTAVERQPITGAYRGYSILTAPPPSSGGVGVLEMLGILDGTGFEAAGAGSATAIHYMTEAMRRFFADRSEHMGDADFVKIPISSMLDPKYLSRLRRSIDPQRATPSGAVRPAKFPAEEPSETTHYTVADAEGNVVCVTYTLNDSFGSKVTPAALGFLLNNEMDDFTAKPGAPNLYGLLQGEANAIQPGKRPLSAMTPTVVLREGRPYLALGSPGGPTIINTVLEVIVNTIDFGMGVQDAVNFPRFHHQWMPDELRMEPGFSPDTLALLAQRGYNVKLTNAQGKPFSQGEVAAIRFANGWLEGAPDPRTEATAEGY
jgi:gamma-glutamyltranspeptidase/glutathione hydrolase